MLAIEQLGLNTVNVPVQIDIAKPYKVYALCLGSNFDQFEINIIIGQMSLTLYEQIIRDRSRIKPTGGIPLSGKSKKMTVWDYNYSFITIDMVHEFSPHL